MTIQKSRGPEREAASGPEPEQPLFRFTRAFGDETSLVPVTSEALGGKGLSLVEMSALGLPVPPGFVISTEAGRLVLETGKVSHTLHQEIAEQVRKLENHTHTKFGDPIHPLFVSIRSGAVRSMPGAMETILNVGLNDQTVGALVGTIGENAAWEAYFHLVLQFARHVCAIDTTDMQEMQANVMKRAGVQRLNELPKPTIESLITLLKQRMEKECLPFPQNPAQQLSEAVFAVFASWNSPEAKLTRKELYLPDNLGTAATVEQMVWGNALGEGSGSGVLLTRNPQDLSEAVVGFAPHQQGSAIVSDEAHGQLGIGDLPVPDALKQQLRSYVGTLETHYQAPQDTEFTVETGTDGVARLYLLQTRKEPLSNPAYVRWLLERIQRGYLTEPDAMRLASVSMLYCLLTPGLDQKMVDRAIKQHRLIAEGQPMSPGHGTGTVVFDMDTAREQFPLDVVLLTSHATKQTLRACPTNVMGIFAENGGIAGHIGRIAARMNIPVIFNGQLKSRVEVNELVTVDGTRGQLFRGILPLAKNGEHKFLTEEQLARIARWEQLRSRNPWKYILPPDKEPVIDSTTRLAAEKFAHEKPLLSRKAKIEAAFIYLIPAPIRMRYDIKQPKDITGIKRRLRQILSSGYDASIRTCYAQDPDAREAPYVSITSLDDIDQFFSDAMYPKSQYGGYPRWLQNPALTEILVGKFPKDKLSKDPNIQHQHCTWSLSCDPNTNGIVIQIRPFSSLLRDQDESSRGTFITYSIPVNAQTGAWETQFKVDIGEELTGDSDASAFARLIMPTIQRWYRVYNLAERLAALGELFPHEQGYAPPVLQGQARIYPDGRSWVLSYDLNVDNLNAVFEGQRFKGTVIHP